MDDIGDRKVTFYDRQFSYECFTGNAGTEFFGVIENVVMDNRNNPNWEEHKNQDTQQKGAGSKEDVNSLKPDDRLKDGTNDLQNGDQDPSSENSNKPSPGREQSS